MYYFCSNKLSVVMQVFGYLFSDVCIFMYADLTSIKFTVVTKMARFCSALNLPFLICCVLPVDSCFVDLDGVNIGAQIPGIHMCSC